jgi:hypothetical protein
MAVSQKQFEALAGFRSALRRFLAFSEEATVAAGVTSQQYQAMVAIRAQPRGTVRLGALADELLLRNTVRSSSSIAWKPRASSSGARQRTMLAL